MFSKSKEAAIIGLTAHTAILHKLVSKGLEVLQPIGDHLRYDLAYYQEDTAELIRIQCKAGRYVPDQGCIRFKNFNRSGGRGEKRTYVGEAEYFGIYCAAFNTVYLVPTNIVSYTSEVSLRIQPTKNNQEKKVIWAKEFEI